MEKRQKAPFHSALLLVRHEEVSVIDRRLLRDAGLREIIVLSSGVQAAQKLADTLHSKEAPQVALCQEQLSDMSGDSFVRLIRMHPGLMCFPVIMSVSTNTPEVRKKAQLSRYSLIVRPYPPSELTKQLVLAAEYLATNKTTMENQQYAEPTKFRSTLETLARQSLLKSDDVDLVYRGALLAMRHQQWQEAVTALQRANRLAPGKGEISLGMAAAWRGLGETGKSHSSLREAVSAFVNTGDWEKAKAVNDRIMNEVPNEPKPLYIEAKRLLIIGKPKEAVKALQYAGFTGSDAARGPIGENTWLYEQLAIACLSTPAPSETLNRFKNYLEELGEKDSAHALEKYILLRIESEKRSFIFHNKGGETTNLDLTAEGLLDTQDEIKSKKIDSCEKPEKEPTNSENVIPLLKEPTSSSALEKFPLLRDALLVAKVTFRLFKAEKKK